MVCNGDVKAYDDDDDEEPLSPTARLLLAPNFNVHITAIMGFKTSFNPTVIIEGLQHTLVKHPRFSSKLVTDGREEKWSRTKVNVENHVTVPNLDPKMENPEEFVEDYISNMTTTPMDFSKPLWELHLLNVKTSDAEAIGVFKIHHSLGDGASLISLLLACTRKTSDPDSLPTVPTQAGRRSRASAPGRRSVWRWWLAILSAIRFVWNSTADIVMFTATSMFLKDTENPLKGGPGVEHMPKRLVHRTISLDDVKLVKNATKSTINDVMLGLTQASLSRYLRRRYAGGSKNMHNLRLRAAVVFNLRPTTGIKALADMMAEGSKVRWGNRIGYILLPVTTALQNDPLDYVRLAKSTIDRKKHSLEAVFTSAVAKLVVNTFGPKVSAAIINRVFSNTTVLFSNVIGPLEEISFYGHPLAFFAPSVYGHPHALTIHFQSYVNKMTISMAVDPTVIPDPHRICEDIEKSLQVIRDAVLLEDEKICF